MLRIAYPRVGSDQAGLGVSVPGAILNYRYGMDSDQLRTRTFAVGDLAENAPEDAKRPVIILERVNPSLPRLDAVDDWPGTICPRRCGTAPTPRRPSTRSAPSRCKAARPSPTRRSPATGQATP